MQKKQICMTISLEDLQALFAFIDQINESMSDFLKLNKTKLW